jgi:flagellar secretion chaperone FliS
MSAQDSAFAYLQSSAMSASPVGRIVALYDTILRDLRRSIAAIESGKIEARVNAVNHALTVIGELQGVLDYEKGGEAARNLSAFYDVTRSMLVKASVCNSREQCQELLSMFTRVRTAWATIEPNIPQSERVERPRISAPPRRPLPNADPFTGQNSADPGNRDWRG